MDLYQSVPLENLPGTPLAEKMRPRDLSELIGQNKVIASLERYIHSGYLPNLIFWGPPGTGKTTVAEALAREFRADFLSINATQAGAKELREIGERARLKRIESQTRSILFVDEVHRFNKGQQDVLLPYIEKGDLSLIGATTENPSYELNRALLSRCRLLIFERLSEENLLQIIDRAFKKLAKNEQEILSKEASLWLARWADGDARKILSSAEEILSHAMFQANSRVLSVVDLQQILGGHVSGHDKASDSHYDLASAMIKSIRGSDPDAGLYYLARLLKGGEDISFIARRLIVLASEDIGNADPRALQVAISGAQAVEMIGLPEAEITLAHMVCYLAAAPKSNRAYIGIKKAKELVEDVGTVPIPLFLRSAKTPEMKNLGYGKDYKYPHDFPRHWVAQSYMPEQVLKHLQINEASSVLYQPDEIGFEKQIREYLSWLRQNTR